MVYSTDDYADKALQSIFVLCHQSWFKIFDKTLLYMVDVLECTRISCLVRVQKCNCVGMRDEGHLLYLYEQIGSVIVTI